MIDRAHQVDQLAVNDADDLLGGIERLENLLADGFLGHAVDELPDDRVADVGFEQRLLDLAQSRRACSIRKACPGRSTSGARWTGLLESTRTWQGSGCRATGGGGRKEGLNLQTIHGSTHGRPKLLPGKE